MKKAFLRGFCYVIQRLIPYFETIELELFKIRIGRNSNISIGTPEFISHKSIIEPDSNKRIIVGKNTKIYEGVILKSYGGDIVIGDNCSINPYTIIYGHGGLTIGNYVLIAGHCMIIPNNHIYKDISRPIALQGNISKGIVIEDNVWIGHGCSILDGVRIREGAVVAAGSVVNKDIGENEIYGGVPAKFMSKRNKFKEATNEY